MFDADLPYRIDTADGPLIGMPFTMEVNDMPLYVRYGNEPDAFTRTLARIVEGWHRLGSPSGCLDITVHAHVFRPALWRDRVAGLAGAGAAQSIAG